MKVCEIEDQSFARPKKVHSKSHEYFTRFASDPGFGVPKLAKMKFGRRNALYLPVMHTAT